MSIVLPSSFDNTLGALVVGGAVAAVLYGINVLQTYIYYQYSKHDHISTRILVGFLALLDVAHLGMTYHTIYHYTVSSYLKPLALLVATKSIILSIAFTVVSNFIVRSVYAVRMWKFSKNPLLMAIVTLMNLTYLVFGMYLTARSFQIKFYADYHELSWVTYVIYAISLVLDALIALSLCFFLRRSRNGIKRTDSIINILMVYCINTGLISTGINIAYLVAYITMPNNFVFVGIYLSSSKLYYCSLLSTLNGRRTLREKTEVVSLPLHDMSLNGKSSSRSARDLAVHLSSQYSTKPPQNGIVVNVDHFVDTRTD